MNPQQNLSLFVIISLKVKRQKIDATIIITKTMTDEIDLSQGSRVDETDLSKELMDLDISVSSFNDSVSSAVDGGKESLPSDDEEEEDEDNWIDTAKRTEIYSPMYKPSLMEQKRLQQLGLDHRTTDENKSSLLEQVSANLFKPFATVCGLSMEETQFSVVAIHAQDVVFNEQECTLILLTHSLILRTISTKVDSTIPFADIIAIRPKEDSFRLQLKEQMLEIFCENVQDWMAVMKSVLLNWQVHQEQLPPLGWIHRAVQTSVAFATAVSNEIPTDDNNASLHDLNRLDEDGNSPLCYAVQLHHLEAARWLLDHGARVEFANQEGQSPMYLAARDHSKPLMALLEEHGAKNTYEEEQRGLLFGQVAVVQAKREAEKQEHEEEKRKEELKAQQAQAQMSENMQLLRERGEKLEEMDSKARELNQNASEFASLARQLKNQSASRNKWLPFL